MSPCHCMTQLALMPKPEAALLGNALQGLINTRNRPKSGLGQAFHYTPGQCSGLPCRPSLKMVTSRLTTTTPKTKTK
ncbi:MAG: hypothetical protein RLZZ245_285 [Verrucomicrobiota bacterium]